MKKPPLSLRVTFLFSTLLLAAGCGGGGGGGDSSPAPPPVPDPSAPAVTAVTPAPNATGVPVGTPIHVTFSRDMDPATLIPSTVSIGSGGTPVTGSLKYDAVYEVTVSVGVRDTSGNPLRSAYTWRFTTESPPVASVAGILTFDNNSRISYDSKTRTATVDLNALVPLAGISVMAVQPSNDNSSTAIALERATAASSGAFHFPSLLPGKQLIVAEGTYPGGTVRRTLGVSSTYLFGIPVLLDVPMKDVTADPSVARLDIFCLDCHPPIGNVTRPDQIYRDSHKSGILRPDSSKSSSRYDEYGWMTCNSCHSVHEPTGFPNYVLGSYQLLCNQCH